ncbi:3',5'-nucleoside bisphosphate phosphatase [Pontiella desulfatans]|uniref:3',5'-nucleoside bisphosphate phosphatase n=1 Tax=Pontiella desulfatans TaxID=2750659 RepID=A0A6C2TZ47_PONDE|nr:PHP domain-containing protein [Pontiella desulfatans]VGO12960.1 3',5'-nucleoside bisphosphate phosphatase [Pontiella desulfatans]
MIDLHVHSVFSDGTNTPEELIKMAQERGLSAMALTDHDTVGGIAPLMAAAADSPVEAVPGIELSAECERGTMHILGYFIDTANDVLLEKINTVREGREERNVEILKKLNKLGYVLMWSDVEQEAGADVVGRPHFAAALVKRGHVKSRKAAFDLLLAKGRPAYSERYRYTASECIELIRRAGGVSVLAHPATIYMPERQLKALVRELREQGLGGIEAYYAEHHPENIARFSGWAKEFGLVCTGGTDFHGGNTPDLKLGTGFGQLRVPDEALALLKDAKSKQNN